MYSKSHGLSGKCIRANEEIYPGTTLLRFDPTCTQKEKTYQTIQVGPDQHCLASLELALLNHSCNPNLIVDTESGFIYAQKIIYPQEELSFFYPSTEWNMARPFICNCGSPKCIRVVRGAYRTPLNVLSSHFLNNHIVELIMENMNHANRLGNFLKAK